MDDLSEQLEAIHEKMAGVSEAEVSAALESSTVSSAEGLTFYGTVQLTHQPT